MKPIVLLSGVDTLHLFIGQALYRAQVARIAALKERAAIATVPPFEIAGHALAVAGHGTKKAPLFLSNEHMALFLNPSPPRGLPTAMIELRAPFLWQRGYLNAVVDAEEVLNAVCMGVQPDTQVTRIDLCADFQGWIPTPADRERFVTRARQCATYDDGGSLTGFSIGRDEIVARLYDKTAELSVSGKAWFRELWARSTSYCPEAPVWRLEFQVRRPALQSFQSALSASARTLGTWASLHRHLTPLFRHLGTHWLSLRLPRRSDSRQTFDPVWQGLVEQVAFDGSEPQIDLYRIAREATAARRVPYLAGYLARGIAEVKFERGERVSDDEAARIAVDEAFEYGRSRGRPIGARAREILAQWRASHAAARADTPAGSLASRLTPEGAHHEHP